MRSTRGNAPPARKGAAAGTSPGGSRARDRISGVCRYSRKALDQGYNILQQEPAHSSAARRYSRITARARILTAAPDTSRDGARGFARHPGANTMLRGSSRGEEAIKKLLAVGSASKLPSPPRYEENFAARRGGPVWPLALDLQCGARRKARADCKVSSKHIKQQHRSARRTPAPHTYPQETGRHQQQQHLIHHWLGPPTGRSSARAIASALR